MAELGRTPTSKMDQFYTRPTLPAHQFQSVPASFCPVHNLPTRFRLVLPTAENPESSGNSIGLHGNTRPIPSPRRSLKSHNEFQTLPYHQSLRTNEKETVTRCNPNTVSRRDLDTVTRNSRAELHITLEKPRTRDFSVPTRSYLGDENSYSYRRNSNSNFTRTRELSRGLSNLFCDSDSSDPKTTRSNFYNSRSSPSAESVSSTATNPTRSIPINDHTGAFVAGYSNRKPTVTPRKSANNPAKSRQGPRSQSTRANRWRSPSPTAGSRDSGTFLSSPLPAPRRSRAENRRTVTQQPNREYLPTVVKGPRTEYRAGMSVFAWGFGKLGQLGNGRTESSDIPLELRIPDTMDRPAKVYTGALFTAILTQKGDVYVCGCGKYGRLGTGSEEDVADLTRIIPARDAKVSQVAAGSWHGCAVTFLGRLYTWGYNSKHNVLGRECDQRCSLIPGLVSSLTSYTVKEVSCGHNFTLLATTDGDVYSWGCGRYGVLGHGHQNCVLKPKKIESLSLVNIASVNAGYAHCGAVSDDGRLYMFGKGGDGALGLGEEVQNRTVPVWVKHIEFISQQIKTVRCSVGEHRGHTLALTNQGTVYAWGSNYKGKLGLGDTDPRYYPTQIPPNFFLPESATALLNENGTSKNGFARIGSRRRSAPPPRTNAFSKSDSPRSNIHSKRASDATPNGLETNSNGSATNGSIGKYCIPQDGITAFSYTNGFRKSSLNNQNGSKINGEPRHNGLEANESAYDKAKFPDELIDRLRISSMTESSSSATAPSKSTTVTKISAGGVHSGAVTEDGRVFTWGCGKDGRLGHPEIEAMPKTYHCTKPKEVLSLRDAVGGSARVGVDISCSHYHTVVLLDFPR